MPKSLADARMKVTLLDALPTDPEAAAVADLTAGQDAQCNVLKSDFRLSATASDTVADSELCSDSNAVTYGASNYEGNMTAFRYFDETGDPDPSEDWLFDAVREKGTHLYIAVREDGKRHDVEWAAGDEYEIWHVITDEPQRPSDSGGFIKRTTPLGPQRVYRGVVAGA